MNDIDKLIKKYGHDFLIQEIEKRKQNSFFGGGGKRRGAPRHILGDLWGLAAVFNHFQSIYTQEKQEYIANRVLLLLSSYKRWEKRPDLYAKELAEHKQLFEKVRWLAGKKLTTKTIINKLAAERRASKRLSPYLSDLQLSIILTPQDFMEGEEFVDDPRDYD
jgi:hypothetical protein